jgi:uncharacterized protein DUF4396
MTDHHHLQHRHQHDDAVRERSHHGHAHGDSLTRTAALATLHCLTGCAIGEVLGMALGTALGLSNTTTVVLSIVLAFAFGYSLTTLPLLRSGLVLGTVLPLAFASDTFSITVMEIVDTIAMLTIPGAIDAGLRDALFWGSLALSLGIAFLAAWPVNHYLIARGQGHAVVHALHHAAGPHAPEPPALDARRLAAIGVAAMAFTLAVGVAAAQIA